MQLYSGNSPVMGEPARGTVTSLSSLFPVDEAQKALQRVNDTIAERRKELDQLNDFVADNKNLVNLVQRLPDKLHHDVMVPFGKAAFFPGRLIHTNEFRVLLGEGYYADRSSKQTVEILTRRGKTLESQVKSLEAVMQDLRAEASFFDATASESAEGLVEIRENCDEEISIGESAASGVSDVDSHSSSKAKDATQEDDDEYARILSRMAELEKEEEEAEKANETSDDEPCETILDRSVDQDTLDQQIRSSEVHNLSDQMKGGRPSRNQSKKDFSEQFQVEASNVQALSEDEYSQGECLAFRQPSSTEVTPRLPVVKDNIKAPVVSDKKALVNNSEQRFDASKAFTGSIVEHSPKVDMQPREENVGRASKPVSRFKMQRK